MRFGGFILITAGLAFLRPAYPQSSGQLPEQFILRVGSTGLQGSEEYRIEKAGDGYHLTGKSRLEQPGRQIDMTQEETLGSDWSLVRYRLEASLAGQSQSIEAWREGDQIQLKASMGTQSKSHAVPFRSQTIVLDNLVVSHYQVLLNAISGRVQGNETQPVLVPQSLAAVSGKLSAGPAEVGRLSNQPIQLSKYLLELGNVLVEIWAESGTHRLMRVFVPIQNVELTRVGFSLADKPAAPTATASSCEERTLTFTSGDLQIPATLCLPARSPGPVPIVILVAGSGPNDRDETIGPNKPFRDLAAGLAAAGIATLRYDKRTFAFSQKIDLKSLTVVQEVVEDALAALTFAKTLPEIKPDAAFLLGHSLGGIMAPLIARRFPELRGVVLMAAAVRPLDELICEQTARALGFSGSAQAETDRKVGELKAAFARVRSGAAQDNEMVLFAPARYWRHLFSLDIRAFMGGLKIPVLVLQGGKDIQVTRQDYDLVRQSLAPLPPDKLEFHWLPNLNHLFMEVSGQSTGAEYGLAGKVSSQVIDLIAAWIKKQSP